MDSHDTTDAIMILTMEHQGIQVITGDTCMYVIACTAYGLKPEVPIYVVLQGEDIHVGSYGRVWHHINSVLTDKVEIHISDHVPLGNEDTIKDMISQYREYPIPEPRMIMVDSLSAHMDKGGKYDTLYGSDVLAVANTIVAMAKR